MPTPDYQPAERRPIKSRDLKIAHRMANALIARKVSANVISVISVFFAAVAAAALVATARVEEPQARLGFVLAAVFIQLRLLANLLDGMVAVGSGRASAVGELYNEVPDRIADGLILVAAGFAAGSLPALGYVAALLAVFIAYLRALGGTVGARHLFVGPMSKSHRMAALTAACLYSAAMPMHRAMLVVLAVVILGAVVTSVRRLWRIAAQLRENAS